ncbi:peroxiredoxin family protein [Fimbriimonas ginsengisoli]|uniref:Alkyl hydroperoxide reductase/ Thiol specific antioxidant/ Mal allergen n=1 Tax=Fimbriimonas ginsengisoli Gsoil 348 TaxID=661478 RepID=A0A068NXS9_FIMGI|nr:TlpA disulfide reductase family protein [Fimbriimonas ginsengisoli]AIE87550.1 alkyl hydroperoxide reductase/ Thiol specific antioxidant/ Mal allergen [Fimbriimonas ginsengisoli Gsoil 348]
MNVMRFSLLALSLIAAVGFGQANPDTKAIEDGINHLRSVPDADRGRVTKELAAKIRALPAGGNKTLLAQLLANLSTEGDFGHDTLQEVANTLAGSLKESPDPKNGFAYLQLAQLSRYEHVSVKLAGPEYRQAVAKADAIDKARRKADFVLNDLDGKAWSLSALRGKVVLVNFWATWCPPCRKEMPDLADLYTKFKDKGLVVLAISDEEMSKVKPFVAEKAMPFPVLLDPGRKVNERYQVDGIPKSFIYDRNGKLVAQSMDMRTRRQFLELLGRAGLK